MIKVQGKLRRSIVLACSGGVDSMAALDFLRRNHSVTLFFVDHNTEASARAHGFLREYHNDTDKSFGLMITRITESKPSGVSWEEFWRNERYRFFKMSKPTPVVTCHHLDDCVEQYLFSSLHGNPGIIPYQHDNVVRPFRLTRKDVFVKWCETHNVPWIEDESNADTRFMRNYIRHELMPHALHVNPGLHKVVKKMVLADEILG